MENWFSLSIFGLSLDMRVIMKYSKLKVLLVFLILITTVGMVSANENVSADLNVNNEIISIDSNQEVTDNVNLLGEGTGNFMDLDDDIANAVDGVVTLNRSYKYDSSNDGDYKNGISISGLTKVGSQTVDTGLTINGNGNTIDADNLARIFRVTGGTVTLNNIKFINGHSPNESNGGAILFTSGKLIVTDCTFENNFADKFGGAIGSSSSSNSGNQIEVYDSTFESNSATFHGGAIYSGNLKVYDSNFVSNKVTTASASTDSMDLKGLGGAIFTAKADIRKTKFIGNSVKNSGIYQIYEGGGAIAVTNKLNIDNCDFNSNTALKGGAILAVAERTSDLVPNHNVTINNSRFNKNQGFDGGAICTNYNITVNNSKFNQNVATGYGGGAINTGYNSNDNKFENTLFFNNTADNYGGALSTSHSKIKNCTFIYNSARHGGAIFSMSFDIRNSTLKDNVAIVGNNIVVVNNFTKDESTVIPESEYVIYSQDEVRDFTVDILNGQDVTDHYIRSGKFEGYQQYCVEQHLFLPSNTEGVLTKDLSYITNSINRVVVYDYLKILFYLKDAYPDVWGDYDTQSITWMFSDGRYWESNNTFVKEIIKLHDDSNFNINQTYYILPNGTRMEYDMQLFLTPTDRQNMVLFKSSKFVPVYNETVSKQTINKTVTVGEDVQFRIIVTNTGNVNLTDVFVKDVDYTYGLVYSTWKKEKGDWRYNEKGGNWTLTKDLEPGENASFIVVFKTKLVGDFRNNVTSGFMNITLSNSTNTTKTVFKPKMSVKKITNKIKVKVGEEVSFNIIVKNECDYDITGVYVEDNYYSKGLSYDYYVDKTNSWKYKGNNRWEYDGALKAHQTAPPLILFFLTTKTGIQFNYVTAGNNLTNKTVKAKNTTNVTNDTPENDTPGNDTPRNDTPKNKTPRNDTKIPKNHTSKNETHTHEKFFNRKVVIDRNSTGNPLFALILVLISLGFMSSKRQK